MTHSRGVEFFTDLYIVARSRYFSSGILPGRLESRDERWNAAQQHWVQGFCVETDGGAKGVLKHYGALDRQ